MTVRIRTVDAFTDKPFTGNPAAVVVLDEAPAEEWMAAVAREMNLSETAFVIRESLTDADFRLRWFTPSVEVDLCGHATLASAHCLFEDGINDPIRFATRSGVLSVTLHAYGSLAMDFHALLAPFWAGRLGRTALVGLQASRRSGIVRVELRGDRVLVSGRAVTILDGTLRPK